MRDRRAGIWSAGGAVASEGSYHRQGWSLVNGSFVFHQTGSESRDKFLASGQHIAVAGTVVGYYLFKRDDESRVDDAREYASTFQS